MSGKKIVPLLVLASIILVVAVATNSIDLGDDSSQKDSKEHLTKDTRNFIEPKVFEVGRMRPHVPYRSVNQCNPNVLLPVNELDPNYDMPKMNENCSCLAFVKSP